MKVNMEKIDKNKVVLEIEVDAEKLSKALDQAYKKVVKKVNIPGFRKGKVPRVILEKQFGKEVLYEDATDIILPDAYFQAVQENELEPIDKPEIDVVQVEQGKPFIFKATVEVKPEVKLGDYIGIEVEKPKTEVAEEQVQSQLEEMQHKNAEVVNVEDEAAKLGDTTVIDYAGYIDGEQFQGGTGEGFHLELGSGSFIPGFEDQVVGSKVGDEKEVKVTFPEDYQAKEVAGKEASFKVKVNGIKRKQLAKFDDEFAKDVSEFETLEELKNDIKNKLKEQAEKADENALRARVVDKAVENAEVEVPSVMVESRLDSMVKDMGERLKQQGMSLEDYFKYTNTSEEQLKANHREEAQKAVKTDLVLETIKKAENIEAAEEDVNQELENMAKQYDQKVEVVKSLLEAQGSLDMLKNSLAVEQTIKLLIDKAKLA